MPAIGIDLGMTSARVAVWQNGTIKVIKSIPCYVAFTNDERLIGEEAKNQVSIWSSAHLHFQDKSKYRLPEFFYLWESLIQSEPNF
jgi:molecular chaperone DnaK (HSP70)